MRLPLANADRYFRAAISERQTALSREAWSMIRKVWSGFPNRSCSIKELQLMAISTSLHRALAALTLYQPNDLLVERCGDFMHRRVNISHRRCRIVDEGQQFVVIDHPR